ncbi:MAG: divalent-cation tolerance protein CutA, partial [Anaerolineae bacterium]
GGANAELPARSRPAGSGSMGVESSRRIVDARYARYPIVPSALHEVRGIMNQGTSCYRVVLMTAGTAEEAAALAQMLVEERLAACVSIVGPIRSIYRWQGRVENGAEHLLIAKTHQGLVERLAARVSELHSYQVPEILSLTIDYGWPPYLAWLSAETAPAK